MTGGSSTPWRWRDPGVVIAALLPCVSPTHGGVGPRHLTWRGTLVDSHGETMLLRARMSAWGATSGPSIGGPLRCIGAGCPFRRGSIDATPADAFVDVVSLVTFGRRGLYRVHVDEVQHLPDFAVQGSYTCDTTGTKRSPPRRVSEGAISLLRYRRPSR